MEKGGGVAADSVDSATRISQSESFVINILFHRGIVCQLACGAYVCGAMEPEGQSHRLSVSVFSLLFCLDKGMYIVHVHTVIITNLSLNDDMCAFLRLRLHFWRS